MRYIIHYGIETDNLNDKTIESKTINVLTVEQINDYLERGYRYRERIYKLTIGHNQYEVICAEIWQKDDNEHSVITPNFIIPGRAYCLCVYLYAFNLYSTNLGMSQRAVARETRKKFDLKTFSHTTVGRAVKALAMTFAEAEAVDNDAAVDERATEESSATNGGETNAETDSPKIFQVEKATKVIIKIAKSFLFNFKTTNSSFQIFKKACQLISDIWRALFHRMLL